jgi:hypothetical protein
MKKGQKYVSAYCGDRELKQEYLLLFNRFKFLSIGE